MVTYVIIPAYNEAHTIAHVIRAVKQYCPNIVVVDDGSKDATGMIAKEARAKVLTHSLNRGQGAALQTGIFYALSQDADVIVTFDADGQHTASDIPKAVEMIETKKVDVALGSRFLGSKERMPLKKLVFRKLALLHQWFFTGLDLTDSHCGFRAFTRSAAQKMRINQDRMSHASEILSEIMHWNLSYRELPVSIKDTEYSLKKGQKAFAGSARILYDFFIGRILR